MYLHANANAAALVGWCGTAVVRYVVSKEGGQPFAMHHAALS